MKYVLIIHAVKDYPAWKRIFDEAASMRKTAGERSYQVLKHENDPNKDAMLFLVETRLENRPNSPIIFS